MNLFSRFLISAAAVACGFGVASALTVSVLPGGLRQAVTASTNPATETELTVTGALNAADFDFLREMTSLRLLDLSRATVAAYSGAKTETGLYEAKANTLPDCALMSGRFTTLALPAGLTEIADGALGGCAAEAVVIPSSVTKIGHGAFSDMKNLRSVTIPASVTSMGVMAFADCPALESAVVNAAVDTLPVSTFRNCAALSSVTLPASLGVIGDRAFAGCSSLAAIQLPASLSVIGDMAFASTGLTAVDLSGRSLSVIGDWAFAGCPALATIAMGDGISKVGVGAFFNDPVLAVSLGQLAADIDRIPDFLLYGDHAVTADGFEDTNVESIGKYALSGMTAKTITLPASLLSLDDNAIERWANLTEIDAKGLAAVPSLGESVWEETPQEATVLYVPQALFETFKDTPQWQDFDVRTETSFNNPIVTEELAAPLRASFDGMLLMVEAPCDILAAQLYDISGRCLTVSRASADPRLTLDTAPFDTRVFLLRLQLADGSTPVLKLLR